MQGKPIATLRSASGTATGKLAIWWLIASEVVIFGGLLASYIMHRIGHEEWGYQAANTDVRIGGFNTLVLLTSSLFAVTAHHWAEKGEGKRAANWLLATTAGGALFAGIKFGIEWPTEISHGFTLTSHPFWSFYYTAAGLHAAHVIAGCIIMLVIQHDARKGRELHRVELIGIYWHFVDLVWIFLFPLLYIAK